MNTQFDKAFKEVFQPSLDWKLCELSGNWTATAEDKSFWIFDTKDGVQLYKMNLFNDEKLIGNFSSLTAAKQAAERNI